jgi:hypothetical protein
VARRPLWYFGFQLDADERPIGGAIPKDLLEEGRVALAKALLEGGTLHPDQGSLTRAAGRLREYWNRSGGALDGTSEASLRNLIVAQLADVTGWQGFLRTSLAVEVDAIVPRDRQRELDRLPSSTKVSGDAVAIAYEVENAPDGQRIGVARIWLREGQARRVTEHDLPKLDRPLRFGVVRSGDEADLRAGTLKEVQETLRGLFRRGSGRDARNRQERRGRRRRS